MSETNPERRSETRAPDASWDFARKATFVVGLGLTATGAIGGTAIVMVTTMWEQDVSMVAMLFTGGLVLAGLLFLKERTMVPIIYKLIDKFMTDAPK